MGDQMTNDAAPGALLPLVVTSLLAAAEPADAQMLRFRGICEASAAVRLDDNTIAVASDDLPYVVLYAIDGADPGKTPEAMPKAKVPLGDITDLEGATRFGQVVLWLTSHSLNKKGNEKAERKKLIATEMRDGTLAMVGTPYVGLRALIAPALLTAGYAFDVDTDPRGQRVLNIEGMTATLDGDTLIGLREPLIGGQAVIIRVRGLREIATGKGGTPEVKAVSLLNLGGNGIREMETLQDGKGYAILGGPSAQSEDGAGAATVPALYHWDGAGAPTRVSELAQGMVGEALLQLPDGRLLVLSDNGGAKIPGSDEVCKDGKTPPEQTWFPAQILAAVAPS